MITPALLLLLGLQAPGPGPAPEEGQEALVALEGPFVPQYDEALARLEGGQLEEAAGKAARLSLVDTATQRRHELARATGRLSERFLGGLLPKIGLERRSAAQRAAAKHLEGVARFRLGEVDAAEQAFQAARGIAAGDTGVAACDGLAMLDLEVAERHFAAIPEVQGVTQNALAPNFRSSQDETQEDPLPLARQAYLDARGHLVERLRADWSDPDARANVELIQRRLKRLDEIEQERRQEEGQERSDDSSSENESNDSSDSSDQGSESQDEREEQEQKPEDSTDEQSENDGESQEGEDEPEESEEQAEGGEGEEDSEPEERLLTKEEQQRLLEQLRRHNLKGQELREQLARLRARGTDKDW